MTQKNLYNASAHLKAQFVKGKYIHSCILFPPEKNGAGGFVVGFLAALTVRGTVHRLAGYQQVLKTTAVNGNVFSGMPYKSRLKQYHKWLCS